MSFVPKVKFPNVPKLPGVPQVARLQGLLPSSLPGSVTLSLVGARLAAAFLSQPTWGVYRYEPPAPPGEATLDVVTGEEVLPEVNVRPNTPVIEPTSFYRLGYQQEWNVSDVPLQDGDFASFNKVNNPYEIELRMVKGGTLSQRAQFLEDCERVGASIGLYRILTPERTYQPINITALTVNREGKEGAYFFAEVDIRFKEIRQVTAQYSTAGAEVPTTNAKDPGARPTQNQGTTNTISPAGRVAGAVEKTLAPLRKISNLIG